MTEVLSNAQNIKIVGDAITFFMIVLGLCAICIWIYKSVTKSPVSYKEIDGNVYNIVFIIALVFGVAIRLWKFGSVPGGFYYDEAMAAVDAKAIADYGTDHYGMKLPVYFQAWKSAQQSVMMGYIMAPIVKLFGLSEVTARMPLLIVSVAGAICFVVLVNDMFGKRAAAIAAVIVAINPWHFMQSRWALDANVFPHFFIISACFLYKGLRSTKWLYVSMIFFGLTMYCYGVSIYTVPFFLLIFAAYAIIAKKIAVKKIIISALIYLVVAAPFILCIMVNFFKWDTITTPFFTIPRFYETQRQSDILFFAAEPLQQLKINIKRIFEIAFLQKIDFNTHAIDGFGTLYLCSVPLYILGFVELFTQKNKPAAVLSITLLLTGIWCGLITSNAYTYRVAVIFYPLMLLTVMGIHFIIKQIKYSWCVILCSYLLIFAMFITTYFTSWATEMERNFFGGFGDALKYMDTLDVDKYYITAESQFKSSKDVSEIYTLFFHDIDAEYFQGKTNETGGETYLPYNQRYIYNNISPSDIKPNENAAYLITTDEKKYFDESKYDFLPYPGYQVNYLVVTKK